MREVITRNDGMYRRWEWPPHNDLWQEMWDQCVSPHSVLVEALLPEARVYRLPGRIRAEDVSDLRSVPVFGKARGLDTGVLYFVDLHPEANWTHDCIYVLARDP